MDTQNIYRKRRKSFSPVRELVFKGRKLFSCLFLLFVLPLLGISCEKNNEVIIYTSTEDFRTAHMRELLNEKFPDYNITLQVLSTGNHAAKLKAEGTQTGADIILNLETGYLESLEDIFADLSSWDLSGFLPELVPPSGHFLPWDKSSGVVVISRDKLESAGLPVPSSYSDLLNPV